MIPEDADPAVVELLRNHPKVRANPELLEEWVRRYYEKKPANAAPIIPDFMLHQKRWSVFKKIWNPERNKFDKLVCTPTGGTPYPGYPNPENNRDFAAYADVMKLCELDTSFVPAYYLLKNDGILFLDYDQPCEKPKFPTYTEKSISGGYHVFGWYKGEKPIIPDTKEVYQDRRWVIVTGDVVDKKEYINDITEYLEENAVVRKMPQRYAPPFKVPEKVPAMRNTTLFKLGCSLRVKGLSDQAVLAALLTENQVRCVPPMTDAEVRGIAKSACRYPTGDIQPAADPIKEKFSKMGFAL